MEKVPFTINGLENLKNEFNNLKKIQRPEIIKAICGQLLELNI